MKNLSPRNPIWLVLVTVLLFGEVYSCERVITSAGEYTETVMDIPNVDGAELLVINTWVDAIVILNTSASMFQSQETRRSPV